MAVSRETFICGIIHTFMWHKLVNYGRYKIIVNLPS